MLVGLVGLEGGLINSFYDSIYREWLGCHFVVLLYMQTLHLAAQVRCKLSAVEFARYDALVLAQHLFGVLR